MVSDSHDANNIMRRKKTGIHIFNPDAKAKILFQIAAKNYIRQAKKIFIQVTSVSETPFDKPCNLTVKDVNDIRRQLHQF